MSSVPLKPQHGVQGVSPRSLCWPPFTPLPFSPTGRRWTAAGAFFSRGGPSEGVIANNDVGRDTKARKRKCLATLAATLAVGLLAVSPARGQETMSNDLPVQAESGADGAERHSSQDLDNAKQWIKRLAGDERDLWTSPGRIRSNDANWFLTLGGVAASLMVADHSIMQNNTLSAVNTRRSVDFSNFGVGALIGVGGALYLWGKKTGDDHEEETGFLSGESALNALAASMVLQSLVGRERPGIDGAQGKFLRGGTSFPSYHSAVAWSIASMIAHQYPGPLTKLFAYGLAGAVSVSRVTGNEHFPSDVLVGGALGWLTAREMYNKHHDPNLGEKPGAGPPEMTVGKNFKIAKPGLALCPA